MQRAAGAVPAQTLGAVPARRELRAAAVKRAVAACDGVTHRAVAPKVWRNAPRARRPRYPSLSKSKTLEPKWPVMSRGLKRGCGDIHELIESTS